MLYRVIIPNQWGQVDYVSDMRSGDDCGSNGCSICEWSSIYGICRAAMHKDHRLHLRAGGVITLLHIASDIIDTALMNYLREIQTSGNSERSKNGC